MTRVDAFWATQSRKAHCSVPPPLHPTYDIQKVIQDALTEDDAGLGDITSISIIPESASASAEWLAKADGVVAGLSVVDAVFALCDSSCELQWATKDGERVVKGTVLGTATGKARALLRAERVALNFMQRMSGIATATRRMVDACAGTRARVLDTRKTVPGLRLLDKWAVLIGGGANHRIGLHDMVMIKDNHITAAGGLRRAVELAHERSEALGRRVDIEVETRTLEEVAQVVECLSSGEFPRLTRVMLDNLARRDPNAPGGVDVSLCEQAVIMIDGRAHTEVSGNVNIDTIGRIAQCGCDFISCGALTHSVVAMDISFNLHVQAGA